MKKTLLIGSGVLVILIFVFLKANHISLISLGLHNKYNTAILSDVAINGYDVVAYHTEIKAVEGDEAISVKWQGTKWLFSSEENKTLFEINPDKYIPELGGYCAFAVSKGFTANPEPTSFDIIEGKLYFFAEDEVKSTWEEDKEENLKRCSSNWK